MTGAADYHSRKLEPEVTVPKSIKQLIDEEEERQRSFTKKIKELKAREASRLAKIAESVKLTDHAVSDAELRAGLQHAIDLSAEREQAEESATTEKTSDTEAASSLISAEQAKVA